ncbi:hypothetical protein GGI43DRAFT_417467 [Trichoderma evansii]
MALYSTASAAYGSLKSTHECIHAIPVTCRDELRPKFFELADIYEQYYEANKALQELRKHERAGTFPIEIEMLREPQFQFSKQFLKSEKETSASYFNNIKQLLEEVKIKALAAVIRAKDEEVIFLERLLRPEEYTPPLLLEIENIYEKDQQLQRGWKEACNDQSELSIRVQKQLDDDYELARKEVPILATRVIEILQSRDVAKLQEALAKIDISKQDKSSASEAASSLRLLNESIDKSIVKMVKVALAKGLAKQPPKNKRANRPKRDKMKTDKQQKANSQAANRHKKKKAKRQK